MEYTIKYYDYNNLLQQVATWQKDKKYSRLKAIQTAIDRIKHCATYDNNFIYACVFCEENGEEINITIGTLLDMINYRTF